MIPTIVTIFLIIGPFAFTADAEQLLSEEAAWMIVMNTPDAVQLEGRGGCPDVDMTFGGKHLMFIQLRNSCPIAGSGLIDNYTLDLRDGQIWTGVDDKKYIDSDRLRRLRILLGIKARLRHK